MTGELFAFYALAGLTLIGAICVVVPPMGRNPLHAALALLATLAFVAGIFVLLSAHLLAVLQVLVYVGAVMVLFTFVVLLLNLRREEFIGAHITPWKVVGVGAIAVFVTKSLAAISVASEGMKPADLASLEGYGGMEAVGRALLTTYLLPFELASILLLVAILGAVVIARREKGGGS